MCGIAGYIGTQAIDKDIFISAIETLVHRGPDAGGHYSPEPAVHLGHRRLAILDLSENAAQPMVSGDDRFCIVFNGEIYNFQEIRKELEELGCKFRSRSDTEVILNGYSAWGRKVLERISGMFAFAIWDRRDSVLFCARDRIGKKPFYYFNHNGVFAFASEAKALLKMPEFEKKLSIEGLTDYLTLGFIPAPRTIWENAHKLPAGHFLEFDRERGSLKIEKYWDIDLTPDYRLSHRDWEEGALERLERAVKARLISDVPLGALLSGGVDSSAVVSYMATSGIGATRTFSIGFENEEFDERPYAAIVAKKYDTIHTTEVLGEEYALELRQKIVDAFDEPFNDTSFLPTMAVCQRVRKDVTVALSGDAGDEAFAGYSKYLAADSRQQSATFSGARLALTPIIQHLYPNWLKGRDRLEDIGSGASVWGRNLTSLGTLDEGRISQLRDQILPGENSDYSTVSSIAQVAAYAYAQDWPAMNIHRYVEFKTTLPEQMFTKVDRASMAASLEIRSPFADTDLLAFVGKAPPEVLCPGRETKGLLKRALRSRLPSEILYRRKQGFSAPIGSWIQSDKSRLYSQMATGKNTLVDAKTVGHALEAVLRYHAAPSWKKAIIRNPEMQLQNLVTLELWARRWL